MGGIGWIFVRTGANVLLSVLCGKGRKMKDERLREFIAKQRLIHRQDRGTRGTYFDGRESVYRDLEALLPKEPEPLEIPDYLRKMVKDMADDREESRRFHKQWRGAVLAFFMPKEEVSAEL